MSLGVGLVGALTWGGGCSRSEPPPGARSEGTAASRVSKAPAAAGQSNSPGASTEAASSAAAAANSESPDGGAASANWDGPWLGAIAQVTVVYPTARFSNERLGYLRRGGKAPVSPTPIKTASCHEGWYQLVDGGYVCGKSATTDLNDSRFKLGVTPPNLDALLPYRYAYNTAHGTPLYRTMPSKEEMLRYEPYLLEKNKDKKGPKDGEPDPAVVHADQPTPGAPSGAEPAAAPGSATSPAKSVDTASPPAAPAPAASDGSPAGENGEEPEVEWWRRPEGDPIQVKLADLEAGDGTLSKRMVKGFFIAVDSTFGWNNRLWYKTTNGLMAPADRMVIPKAPELKGMEIPEGVKQVGFVLASKAHKYAFDGPDKKPKPSGAMVKRFTPVALTGETRLVDKQRFHETKEGWWLREADATYTSPGPLPSDLSAGEKWIDVNLERRTLVAFEGERPVYAALISPGKHSTDKKRDHRTKSGTFRIREKHIATTMDGDGPVAGDMPYSIEDVPYVQYYDGSYALHGAFWHNNFGSEHSHGCVNLSPLDAKWLFFWTEPSLPRGWHGVWASAKHRGTLVAIHE